MALPFPSHFGGEGGAVNRGVHEMAQGLEAAEMESSDAKSHFLKKSPPTLKHLGHQRAYSRLAFLLSGGDSEGNQGIRPISPW